MVPPGFLVGSTLRWRFPIGFFNPVIPTCNFVKSLMISRVARESHLPRILSIPNLDLALKSRISSFDQIREIPDPKKPIGDHILSVGSQVCRHTGRSDGFKSGDFWGTKLTSDPLKKWLPVRLDGRHSGVQINFWLGGRYVLVSLCLRLSLTMKWIN